MENVFTSIRTSFKNRVTSPLIGSFIIAWILWNRNIVYSALFLSQELIMNKYGLLKDEYLIIILHEHCLIVYSLLLPIISIVLIYYILPYLDEIVYDQYLTNRDNKKSIKMKKDKQREKDNTDLLKKEEENLKQKEENLKQKEEIIIKEEKLQKTQEELEERKRNDEYKEISKHPNFKDIIEETKTTMYQKSGSIKTYSNGLYITNISSNGLSFMDINGLITISDNKESISLTKKGKYIIRLYENNQNK